MKAVIFIFLFASSICFAQNDNMWHPDSSIPNVYLTELYTFNGLPKDDVEGRDLNILVNHGFAIGYDEERKGPAYAIYRYGNLANKAEDLDERNFERPPKFQIDLRTNAKVHHNDYTSSGFQRGHMAPNYGLRTQFGHLAQIETFLMSNILPQHGNLNENKWAEAEKKVADKLAQDDNNTNSTRDDVKDLWVISGPIYGNEAETLGDTGISIPTGYYKIMVRRKDYFDDTGQAIGLYYEHVDPYPETDPDFVTIDWIETETGLDFHPNMPDRSESKLESIKYDWDWNEIDD